MLPAIVLTCSALVYRLLFLLAGAPAGWGNFSPLAAICLCFGAYAPRARWAALPALGLLISDVVLNAHYGVAWLDTRMIPGYFCFGISFLLGRAARRRGASGVPGLGRMLACAALGSLVFYVVTNTAVWCWDAPAPLALTPYARTWAGWWQALTTGHAGFPPTILFLRNTALSDALFTAAFVATQALAARRSADHPWWPAQASRVKPVTR